MKIQARSTAALQDLRVECDVVWWKRPQHHARLLRGRVGLWSDEGGKSFASWGEIAIDHDSAAAFPLLLSGDITAEDLGLQPVHADEDPVTRC